MHFSLVGINHQTTPISIREQVAVGAEELPACLSLLRRYAPHGLIVSTCNRTEVYTTSSNARLGVEASMKFLKAHSDMSDVSLLRYVYIYEGESLMEQLFQVACGLDSMIVGEFEVLGQVGHALQAAEKAGMVNLPLRHLFQSAIRAGRRVRVKTGISRNTVSISSVAVDLAERVVGDLTGCKIVVIGAGEAGRLVAKVARERGAGQIVVANRSQRRAAPLAKALGGISVDLDSLVAELSTADIVVTCAGAPRRLLDSHHVAEAMRSRSELPLVIIDIAVPRDVEPAVKRIENVFLYDIDDLTGICEENRQRREGEIEKAREIMATDISKFVSWWRAFEVRPVVGALMKKAEDIRCAQLDKTLKKLHALSDEERDSLEAMTRSIVTKILKDPVEYLKANVNSDRDGAEMVGDLFQLPGIERRE